MAIEHKIQNLKPKLTFHKGVLKALKRTEGLSDQSVGLMAEHFGRKLHCVRINTIQVPHQKTKLVQNHVQPTFQL